MRPVLLDTNAYTAFKLGDKAIVDVVRHTQIIGMSPIVLGELLSGFDYGNKALQNRTELLQFLESSRIAFYPITVDSANCYSRIYCALRKNGNPIPTNDLWIAAQAIEHGCSLCSYDKHFRAIDGLIVGTTCAELL